MRIVDWNADTGPTMRPYKPRWERIQEKVATGDKAGAGNLGRQYLEWILERVCEAVAAPVPFKRSRRYEARELMDPAKQRVQHLARGEEFDEEVSQAFQELERTVIMGNLLSHNSTLADQISLEEANSFCMAVHSLHNEFLCPICGKWIGYYRNLRILRCSNPRCTSPIELRTR